MNVIATKQDTTAARIADRINKMDSQLAPNDHDVLIELRTEMRGVRSDIKDLKEDSAHRISLLEDNKIDKREVETMVAASTKIHEDHERRIRKLEYFFWLGMGGIIVIELVIKYYAA